MSSDPVILVQGVHKTFPMYDKPHHRLMELLDPRKNVRWRKDFHALKGIDLEVSKGHTVGIVGRNGSGKSTLLQIICGTLSPTLGNVEVRGRVAALLELGAGFNPEFSGRENVFLNAAILGLSRSETEDRLDEILAFADIGEFIDQPVKSYSSGMYVRLAFSVAVNVTPEILIVDEALSVGDEAFQRKCYARIEKIREAGATVLFVSHSAGTVVDLCDQAVLLDSGEMLTKGAPKRVVTLYQKLIYAPLESQRAIRQEIIDGGSGGLLGVGDGHGAGNELSAGDGAAADAQRAWLDPGLVPESTFAYERRGAEIMEPRLSTPAGEHVNMLVHGHEYTYSYRVAVRETLSRVRCGMMIRTTTGVEVGGFATNASDPRMVLVPSGTTLEVRFRFRCLLNPGTYFLNAGCLANFGEAEEYADRRMDVAMFKVIGEAALQATALVNFVECATIEWAS